MYVTRCKNYIAESAKDKHAAGNVATSSINGYKCVFFIARNSYQKRFSKSSYQKLKRFDLNCKKEFQLLTQIKTAFVQKGL